MRRTVRATLFKIHTWLGLGAGLYVGLMSLSGSVLVFYPELYRALTPQLAIVERADRLTRVQLKEAAQRAHPGFEVTWIWERRQPAGLVEIWMTGGGKQTERLFNAFTGDDLGSAIPFPIWILNALKDFHSDLLAGGAGQILNAAGAFLMTLLGGSGLWLLWPEITSRWIFHAVPPHGDRLLVRPRAFHSKAHRTLGFWILPCVLISGVTGLVLALETLLNTPKSFVSLSYVLHVMAFGWWPVRLLWALLGFAVPVLAITGLLMWSTRVRRSGKTHFAGPLSS